MALPASGRAAVAVVLEVLAAGHRLLANGAGEHLVVLALVQTPGRKSSERFAALLADRMNLVVAGSQVGVPGPLRDEGHGTVRVGAVVKVDFQPVNLLHVESLDPDVLEVGLAPAAFGYLVAGVAVDGPHVLGSLLRGLDDQSAAAVAEQVHLLVRLVQEPALGGPDVEGLVALRTLNSVENLPQRVDVVDDALEVVEILLEQLRSKISHLFRAVAVEQASEDWLHESRKIGRNDQRRVELGLEGHPGRAHDLELLRLLVLQQDGDIEQLVE